MSGAGEALQAAALARLATVPALGRVYPGSPLQGATPYATVEAGAEADWSHKSGEGREVRLALSLRDAGESPGRIRSLMAAAEAAIQTVADVPGWQLVCLSYLRSRLVRGGTGREAAWTALIEYRARLLARPPG
jgi:hypothetical protein